MQDTFLEEVVKGLSLTPKQLPSKYFYDAKGDVLFQEIMAQPEYYLTNAEFEILEKKGHQIINKLDLNAPLRVLEAGAGDGSKAKILMNQLVSQHKETVFSPIDISPDVLEQLKSTFDEHSPHLKVEPIVCDYFNIKNHLPKSEEKKWMLFLGSNIGNYPKEEAEEVLQLFTSCLNKGDYFLIGIDLVKNPDTILKAYNDSNGATERFNLNLLSRINKELNADFNIENFRHYPIYNPVKKRAESYIMSTKQQEVSLMNGQYKFKFKPWEVIHTEISRKYYPEQIHELAVSSKCEVIEDFYAQDDIYMLSLWKKQ